MAKSIIQNNKTQCFLCGRNGQGDSLEEHHVYGGPNRKNSEKYGLKVYLCGNECHRNGKFSVHQNAEVAKKVKRIAQFAAMTHYKWSEDEFRTIFGKSYI